MSPNDRLQYLLKVVRSFQRADTELRRAEASGEQPRLSKAGTRYYMVKHRLFESAS